MAREPRSIRPGGVYHLISRFVDRDWLINTRCERDLYIKLLGRALGHCDWRLLAFAIMSNHIHLAAIAGRMPLDQWIRRVHSPFANSLNRTHNRIGAVFVRGPKDYEVALPDVAHVIAYIHNNPVRAGVCDGASSSDWTSHRAFVGQAMCPAWLHVQDALALASMRRSDFDAWVNDPMRREREHEFTEEYYEQRRLEEAAKAAALSERTVSSRDSVARDYADTIVSLAADTFGVTQAQLRSISRGSTEVSARAAVVHAATRLGLTGAQIARALNLSQQRVSVLRRTASNDEVAAASTVLLARIGVAAYRVELDQASATAGLTEVQLAL